MRTLRHKCIYKLQTRHLASRSIWCRIRQHVLPLLTQRGRPESIAMQWVRAVRLHDSFLSDTDSVRVGRKQPSSVKRKSPILAKKSPTTQICISDFYGVGFSEESGAFTLLVCRATVSSFFPRKLSPLMVNTVASSKILSRAHSKASSSLKLPLQCEGCLLLVNTILKLPSLLYLRSIRSKNRRVFSLSNSQCPTSSIIRQDGRTKPLSTEASFPARLAAVNLSCNSDILMK